MTNLDKSIFFNDNNNNNNNAENNNNVNATKNETTTLTSTTTATDPSGVNTLDIAELKVYTIPNAYNPKEFNINPKAAHFFVIKSYLEDDVHRSIKYNIWCSTKQGNRRLDSAYFKGDSQVPVYLFFSVNCPGHFCGMAEMMSRVDYNKKRTFGLRTKIFQVK
jgi:hypothetical protein